MKCPFLLVDGGVFLSASPMPSITQLFQRSIDYAFLVIIVSPYMPNSFGEHVGFSKKYLKKHILPMNSKKKCYNVIYISLSGPLSLRDSCS